VDAHIGCMGLVRLKQGANNMNILKTFLREENGATAIEYGLIAALISIVLVITLGLVGTNLDTVFTDISTALTGA
jgi:pilus assembly protein Flp/PilA